ncbi:MAG: FHIPEP family type III secretion protein [Myxococcales bacterium]|nr:FHIPEP family type III secretion protein [Myxococcales bacterium]
MVFPVPTWLLDGLLSAQLGLAVVVLLTALGARDPLALSQFPTVLLLGTLLRLALNVSTTRLILAHADAGAVVAAFGDAVVAGDVLVGAAVFGVITLVQYLVIARGAERVAQVSARFALDGLPGRQLAIDADLRAGLIDPEAARGRRVTLDRASSLFGAMDGAMKFVRGDALAGLAIVALNVVGGLVIGVARQGLPLDEALATYTTLTVGDGLLTQLPAVLTATAAALLVTRVAAPDADGPADAILAEFARDRRALLTAGGLLALLGLLPGLPGVPLLGVGLGLAGLGWRTAPGPSARRQRPPDEPSPVAPLGLVLHPDAVTALAPLTPQGLVTEARRALRDTWGVPAPEVAVRVTADGLPPGGYRVEAGEAAVRRGVLTAGERFVCPAAGGGRAGAHPVTGAPGRWLPGESGEAPGPWLTALAVTAWRQAGPHVMGLQQVAALVARLEGRAPALVRAVMPRRIDLPALAGLLRALLAEGVPLRGLGEIFEALAADGGPPDDRLATVRRALAHRISATTAPTGQLEALVPDREAEAALRPAVVAPMAAEAFLEAVGDALTDHPRAALLVAPEIRTAARTLCAARFPGLPVLTARELASDTRVVPAVILTLA